MREHLDSGRLSQSPISHQEVLGAAIKLPYRSTGNKYGKQGQDQFSLSGEIHRNPTFCLDVKPQ
jgi:hypothetical protein